MVTQREFVSRLMAKWRKARWVTLPLPAGTQPDAAGTEGLEVEHLQRVLRMLAHSAATIARMEHVSDGRRSRLMAGNKAARERTERRLAELGHGPQPDAGPNRV